MKIEHETNFISNKVECFKVSFCTVEDYEKITQEFKILDSWLTLNSVHSIEDTQGEFSFYIVLDMQNSMLFKLRYSSDK